MPPPRKLANRIEHSARERPLPNAPSPPSPGWPRPARLLTPLMLLAASGAAWGYFIAAFGWSGALLGWWPAAVIGGGGALAALQAIELGFRTRRAEPQPAPASDQAG